MQIIDNKTLVLRTRHPDKYAIIPRYEPLRQLDNGVYEVAVPWGLDEVRVLKNLGVRDVPSPILGTYNWPGRLTPFDHQRETAAFLTMHKRAFVFSEPGTGKTLSALWAADYLMTQKKVRRCLVVCPLSIMQSAWMGDISKSVLHRSAVVAYHSQAERRIEALQGNYRFVVTNYDSLPILFDAILEDGRFDLIIGDEANAWKNTSTRRWKLLNRLLRPETHLWLMTGTPAAQSPVDAFGLARLVNPAAVPRYVTAWRDKVMRQVSRFRWVPKDDARQTVFAALQPAIRFTKAQCLDLPPVLTETREVELTAQQKKYYRLIKEQMMATAAGETITAVHAAASVSKLLQISSGAAYTDTHEVIEFDCAPRLAVLEEVLEETERKVLVFAHFRHNLQTIADHLTKRGVVNAMIHGDVKLGDRNKAVADFQNLTHPLRVLIIQPDTAQHGLTLTAADTVVFWGPVGSVETYIQCVGRMDRQGQTGDHVTVVHLQGSPIERKRFNQLASGIDEHLALVKLYEEELEDAAATV